MTEKSSRCVAAAASEADVEKYMIYIWCTQHILLGLRTRPVKLHMTSGSKHGVTPDFWQIAVFDFIGIWPWDWCGIPSYYERA